MPLNILYIDQKRASRNKEEQCHLVKHDSIRLSSNIILEHPFPCTKRHVWIRDGKLTYRISNMEELIEKFEEAINTRFNVVRKESVLNPDGHVSRYYVIHENALGLVIVDEHPIESLFTAAVFVKDDQQRVKNALISQRPIPQNTRSHILYRFRVQQRADDTFSLFKNDDTEYQVNTAQDVVEAVASRLMMEIAEEVNKTDRSENE